MNVRRIPRPLGLTNIIRAYNIDPTEENKQRVNEHVVKTYVTNGFTWNYRKISIDELSIMTGISINTLLMNLTRVTRTLASLASPAELQNTLQALVGLTVQNSINDRGEAEEQLFKLKLSQGTGYAPFISSEVGKTIKLMLDSNKNIMDVIKTINPTQTLIQINNTGNEPDMTHEEKDAMLTTDKAILMISSNQDSLKDNSAMLNEVFEAELIDDTPIVDARKQKGDHGDKEGLGLKKLTSGEHLENIKHEERRQEEYDADLDADEI